MDGICLPEKIDISHAVEIADRIWWVGHCLKDDTFQCNAYLIENGKNSALIDPGSNLTFERTLCKIKEVIPFDNIRYFICHHQDPDITAILPLLDKMIIRNDCFIITHWRAKAVLKHFNIKIPFWCVEENNWKIDIGDRLLQFIFTPYLHFPGAFCTFDNKSGILFSSDIFGGFTKEWDLFAEDEKYFESLQSFHEHYMPSNRILLNGLAEIEKYPVRTIAPQHGSIIKSNLVEYMTKKLKDLDCGLFLLNKDAQKIERLSQINTTLKSMLESMVYSNSFKDFTFKLLKLSKQLLPVESLEYFICAENKKSLHLTSETHYRGDLVSTPSFCKEIWKSERNDFDRSYILLDCKDSNKFNKKSIKKTQLLIPLFFSKHNNPQALAIFCLSRSIEIDDELDLMIGKLSIPLAVTTEREAIYRMLELENDKIYAISIRDNLTNLFTRSYMNDAVGRLIKTHVREPREGITLVVFDIDHFKNINDTYGHIVGDLVLKKVAESLLNGTRTTDIQVRYGGEEFMVFMPSQSICAGTKFAERFRGNIQNVKFKSDSGKPFTVTISAGVAFHRQEESLVQFIQRADNKLYEAKEGGRNQVCIAD